MLRMEWNALRVGDRVLVHDDDDLAQPLAEGTITILQSRPAGWNDLAIHLAGSAGVTRPRGGACHLLPLRARDCWRCDVLAAGPEKQQATSSNSASDDSVVVPA